MSADYGHAALLLLKPTWLATAYAEIAADTRDLPRPTQVDGTTWLLLGAAG